MKDAVIALAVLVLLIALWRLMKQPKIFGHNGSTVRSQIFGPFGTRLAQTIAGNIDGGDSPSTNSEEGVTETNLSPRNSSNLALSLSNQAAVTGDALVNDDSRITNHPVKAIVTSAPDFSYTNGSLGGTTTSLDAASLARRLSDVGAKSGDIQISLSWNNYNDLDLHCVDPKGVEIWFSNTNSILTGGELDHDANASSFSVSPVENIYWPVGGAPGGRYQVFVVYYAQHGGADPTRFTVRVLVQNQTNYFSYAIRHTGNHEKYWICTFQYDPDNPDPAKRRRFLSPN